MRKDTSSTLLVFSATAIALVLLCSPMLFFNVLLQPVQAQTTTMTFKTLKPAISSTDESLLLTFDAQGNSSTPNPSSVDITNGTIQWQDQSGGKFTAEINSGNFDNNRGKGEITLSALLDGVQYKIQSDCGTSEYNPIIEWKTLGNGGLSQQQFTGPVECSSSSQGGNSTTQSASLTGTTTTTQDSDGDGDGIPDSSDKCTHDSNPRCFKEGGDVCTTAQQQPSSNRTGNQTR